METHHLGDIFGIERLGQVFQHVPDHRHHIAERGGGMGGWAHALDPGGQQVVPAGHRGAPQHDGDLGAQDVGAFGIAAAIVLVPAAQGLVADGVGRQRDHAAAHHGFGQPAQMLHVEKRVERQIDVALPAVARRPPIEADGAVRNAGPEHHQPAARHGQRLAVEQVFHAAGGQPVELDVAVKMLGRHDLGVEPANAEAAEGLGRGVELPIGPGNRGRRLFPLARSGGRVERCTHLACTIFKNRKT